VTGAADGLARLWDLATGQLLASFNPNIDRVTSVEVSPDGRFVVLRNNYDRHVLTLWELCDFVPRPVEIGLERGTHAVFSPSGRLLVTFDLDEGRVYLWNLETRALLSSFQATEPSDRKLLFRFSPDSKFLAYSDGKCQIHFFDIERGDEAWSFLVPTTTIVALAFTPEGKTSLPLTRMVQSTCGVWRYALSSAASKHTEVRRYA
jgi:WD40 repeat protein